MGLFRELSEETGAQEIKILSDFGYVDEVMNHPHSPENLLHMTSFYFVCKIGTDFAECRYESYEIASGMEARWILLKKAIEHNQRIIAFRDPSIGISIHRETRVMKLIEAELYPLCLPKKRSNF